MSYTHFTITERAKIEVYLELGYSIREIGRKLGRHASSVSRELKRNPDYQAERAQENYKQNKTACGAHIKLSPALKDVIQEKLSQTWSPEQIVGRLFQSSLSFKTIYRWLYAGLLELPLAVLRQKGKRQQPKETRGRFNIGTPISKRPKEVRQRTTFGHWELDTVVSGRGKAKGCVATFIERKTRWYQAILMPDRSAVILLLRLNWESLFISLILILLGKEAVMKIVMGFLESSFLNKRTSIIFFRRKLKMPFF